MGGMDVEGGGGEVKEWGREEVEVYKENYACWIYSKDTPYLTL
jgi:hypothetical protein